MNERECLIREIAQRLRDIADKIDQNQSSLQYSTILINSLMYCCNFYLKL
jgi:hypothetical protein